MLTAEEAYNKTSYNIECKICEFLNPIIIEETMKGEFGVCINIEYLIEKIKYQYLRFPFFLLMHLHF